MASSSSSPRTWKYNVFTSFHGPDVRKTFLSHLRKQFNFNGITMFDDQGIERSKIIAPALTQAIRESRISIIVLSKKYASSNWCLDELLEILKCQEDIEQIVMSVFYGVDPSDVRKQTGDFGIAFKETCAHKTEEERRKWSQALTYVGNIAGEHFQNWDSEAKMIEKIARDVSDKLNATPCRDFDGMVGLDDHLKETESLLDLDNVEVKVVGISGPAGIGKSTIARALHSRLSNRFQHTCFVEKLREKYKIDLDEYGLKLHLHKHLLSKILNQNGMQISHLGVIKERLHDKKVLIILDDVERLDQLEALANIMWFGPGSRVIVTTENKDILQKHGINVTYHVGFPSRSKALMIFCLSGFRQTSPPNGFMDLADAVVSICGNLPLGLNILGSSLRGKSQADWIDELPRLKSCLNREIECVLKVGYESLTEKSNLDVKVGLNILANRCLIHIDSESRVVMARQLISQQERWKILVDTQEISYVLEDATGDGSIKGVSFDIAEIDEIMINPRAFEKMCNLLFLKVYNVGRHTGKLHIPEDIEFPCRIRLFHWDAYPGKSLPLRFLPANLIELNMVDSELEKLWEGTQLLANLEKINLSGSSRLKELPDLSNATNLERLDLSRSSRLKKLPDLSNATNLERLDLSSCTALVELPSSITNLHKLNLLLMYFCESLEVIPTLINLAFLTDVFLVECSRLRRFPEIPTNTVNLKVNFTALEEFPASLTRCSGLEVIEIYGNVNLKAFLTQLPTSVKHINISYSGIERITDCIKGLHNLEFLILSGCKRLVSLPELPPSLEILRVDDCESLERVNGHLITQNAELNFTNCFELDREARRAIIQQWFVGGWALLPGTEVPAEFNHRARGNSLTIPCPAFNIFKVCVVMSPNYHQAIGNSLRSGVLFYHWTVSGNSVNSDERKFDLTPLFTGYPNKLQKAHLFIFLSCLPITFYTRNIVLEFGSEDQDLDIIECGVQILTDETDRSNNGGSGDSGCGLWDIDEFDSVFQDFDSVFQDFDIIECANAMSQILTDETDGSNSRGSGDEDDDNGLWDTDEFDKSSDKEEEDDDSAAKSESAKRLTKKTTKRDRSDRGRGR